MKDGKESNQGTTVLGEDLDDVQVETEASDKTTTEEEVKNYLSELVGEDKKYKTEEDLAKAYSNADNFIETLKTEKRELEAEMGKAKTIEDVLAAIGGSEEQTPPVPEPAKEDPVIPSSEQPTDIRAAVAEVLKEQETTLKENQNVSSAWESLDKAYGDRGKAKVAVREFIGGDPNVKNALDLLGKSNPAKLVEMVTASKKTPVSFIDESDGSMEVSEEAIINQNDLTWEKLAKLKKENPKKYYSREVQPFIHKAVAEGRLIIPKGD